MSVNIPPGPQAIPSVPNPPPPGLAGGPAGPARSWRPQVPHGPLPLNTRVFLILLGIILVISILGSASLATQFLSSPQPQATAPATQPASVGGKGCTLSPLDIKYQPLPSPDKRPYITPLPAAWFEAGLHEQDVAYAFACAADFTQRYQSFDAAHLDKLTALTTLLSASASKRFSSDAHMKQDWRTEVQNHHTVQVAKALPPSLQDVKYTNKLLLAWLSVPYTLSVQKDGKQTTENQTLTVLLVTDNNQNQGTHTVWQVSSWQDGSSTFSAPDHP